MGIKKDFHDSNPSSEEGLLQLIEYFKSLKAVPSNATGAPAAAPATPEKK